jgi:hypothetical protein
VGKVTSLELCRAPTIYNGNVTCTDKYSYGLAQQPSHTMDPWVCPVICLIRNIPRPSSILIALLIPITLLGRGRIPDLAIPSCFVGLILRVGLKPPPVSCLKIPSPPPIPVNCRARVVAPVKCGVILFVVSAEERTGDDRVGEV